MNRLCYMCGIFEEKDDINLSILLVVLVGFICSFSYNRYAIFMRRLVTEVGIRMTDQIQRVAVRNQCGALSYGAPQSPLLFPMIFNLYVKCLCQIVHSLGIGCH